MGEIIVQLVAVDGLTFNQLAKSVVIRRALKSDGYNLPKSRATITKIFMEERAKVKENLKNKLKALKESGQRFSLSLDESTSVRNRRYMNLNIHDKNNFYSLGMVRITGTMNFAKAKDLVAKRLAEFGLEFESDIVSTITDGAAVMKKFGRETAPLHTLCLAHAIHLCVCDVIYKRSEVSQDQEENEEEHESEEDCDCEGDCDCEYEDINDTAFFSNFGEIVSKVRRTIKIFRKSPVNNDDALQPYVVEAYGEEKVLFLDCRTRWNSTLKMLKRFYELKKEVQMAMIKLDKPFEISQDEFSIIKDVCNSLEPIEIAVNYLCQKDADLILSEKIVFFTLKKLAELDTPTSRALHRQLTIRVEERRNVDLIHLVEYLNCPDYLDTASARDQFGRKISKPAVIALAASLLQRLYPDTTDGNNALSERDEGTSNEEQVEDTTIKTVSEEYAEFLLMPSINATTSSNSGRRKTERTILKQECSLYESTKTRPENLEKLHKCLLTIKPTSVEPERAFSVMGLFLTKIRNRLSDNMLDAIIFLRHQYQLRLKDN